MHGTHWWLQGAKSTLFMFGWQRVFSSAWHRQCAVVFGTSMHPSCPPDINSPRLYRGSVASRMPIHVYMYVCVCSCLEAGMNPAALLFTHPLHRDFHNFSTEYRIKVAGSGSYQFFIQ